MSCEKKLNGYREYFKLLSSTQRANNKQGKQKIICIAEFKFRDSFRLPIFSEKSAEKLREGI